MKLILLTLSLLLVLHCELTSAAIYTGKDAKDARRLLNAAQGVLSHGYSGTPGNPRAYASSDDDSTGMYSIQCIEDFTINGAKVNGFLNRDDQNDITHRVLRHSLLKYVMEMFHSSAWYRPTTAILDIPTDELPDAPVIFVGIYQNGTLQQEYLLTSVRIAITHFSGQQNNRNYAVFIQYIYPNPDGFLGARSGGSIVDMTFSNGN